MSTHAFDIKKWILTDFWLSQETCYGNIIADYGQSLQYIKGLGWARIQQNWSSHNAVY